MEIIKRAIRMSNGNVHIVNGMEAIINPDNIRAGMSGFDLKKLEKSMIEGGLIQQAAHDPQDRFRDDLNEVAKKLGIDFGDVTKDSKTIPIPSAPPTMPVQSYQSVQLTPPIQYSQQSTTQYSQQASQSEQSPQDDNVEEVEEEEYEEEPEQSQQLSFQPSSQPSYTPSIKSPVLAPMMDREQPTFTVEQQTRSCIDTVLGAHESSGFSFEKEKREDIKYAFLAEIDNLIESLTEENIDISRIPKVERLSSYEDVESVLKILRRKSDHIRFCSFAEEFLIFGAYALEELFDGKRVWLGKYKPDMVGYHNQLNVKLRRLRPDTGQIVSTMIQDYNIGPGARVILELVPNMVLYSKMRSNQYSQPGLYSDDTMQDSMNRLEDNI